ncbi:ribonuclease HI family protein [Granulicella cerasi]|uniref:Ribonuclease HI family protein n=1 Tax=Granulicella cerasi TaxID=741063 RepID=A0ABW1ZBT2_9BACT|nr:ribonuclease HI family protein [Granulicella cerasi]
MSGNLFGNDPVPSEPAAASDSEWLTAHCDGGSRGNPGPAGFGAVVVSPKGENLAELSEFLGIFTNNVAEYRGLLSVLEWVVKNGYKRVRVVSDSLLMVNQINGKYKVNSPDLRELWMQARGMIKQLDGFEITHALRHKNKDADRLANEAMDRGTGKPAAGRPAAAIPYPKAPGAPQPPSAGGSAPRPAAAPVASGSGKMFRGFVRDGQVHLLGDARLPDGVFVKVVVE